MAKTNSSSKQESTGIKLTRAQSAQLAELARDKSIEFDLDRDWMWAYQNMRVTTAEPADAPSATAWQLLEYARANEAKFLDKTVAWAERKQKAEATDRKGRIYEDDRREKTKLIDRVVASISDEIDSLLEELVSIYGDALESALSRRGWVVISSEG